FLALLMVTASAFQAIGKERLPILSLGAWLLVKLVSMPPLILWLGKVGAPLSTLFFFLVVCFLNLFFVRREIGIRLRMADVFFRPALCAILSALSALLSFLLLSRRVGSDLSLLFSLLVAVLVYGASILFTRAVSRSLVEKLPFGDKVLNKFDGCFRP
ncbi:MAG: polysaccharide biosynthesis C-terminal domain-containing protein, partial [Clostridia bacterium]|nr:polysaccharide biosynthesis C-terminal domain-containing protein [Clostridia bacterium]